MEKKKMVGLLDKKAVTKIQAMIVTLIIIVAAITGAVYYLTLPGPGPSPEKEVTLAYQWVTDISSWDPATIWATDGLSVVRACYERLLRLKGSTMEIEPLLAESWDISTDGLEYIFHLRKGVKFADGTPFNATAVKASFDRLIGIGQQSHDVDAINETRIIDTYTVKFVLASPFSPLLKSLTEMQTSIINPNALEKHKTAEDPWAMDWFHDWTNGTGPYMLKEWKKGESWTMVKNPNYWRGWEGKHIDKLTSIITAEPATARMMIEKGDIDISFFIARTDIPELQLNPYMRIVEYPAMSTFYLSLNNQKAPLDDVHVRKALSYAFDYSEALAVILYHGKQARGFMPSSLEAWSNETFQYTKDLTKAREELAQSAYPEGGFTLSYIYCAGVEEQRKMGAILEANLAELNIGLTIESQPWVTYVATMSNPETARDVSADFNFVLAPDPHFSITKKFHSSRIPPNGANWVRYNNSVVDQLLDEAVVEQDEEVRANMYHQIDEILVEDAAVVFVYEETKIVTMGTWVHEFVPNAAMVETFNFYDMYIVEEERP